MAQKFLSDIHATAGIKDSSGDLGASGQVLSSTGSNTNWVNPTVGTTVIYKDAFTATNGQTAFTLANTVDSEDKTQVYIDGAYQSKGGYTVSGTTLTFDTGLATSSAVEVITFSTATANNAATAVKLDTFTGDGSDLTFVLNEAVVDEKVTQVYINGVYQNKSTYFIDADLVTLTFGSGNAPPNYSTIEVISFKTITSTDGTFTATTFLGDLNGTINTATTATTQSAGNNSTKISTTAYTDAKVADAINNGTTAIAPSQNAVFDALALKANIAGPTFTGTPAAPTASAGTNTTQLATTAFVTTGIANIVDSAPGTLNTLNELAAALGDDVNFSTTVTNSIATKAPLASPTFTGNATFNLDGDSSLLLSDGGTNASVIKSGSGDELYIGANNTYALRFLADGTNNVVFDNNSKVGIGTASPGAKLEVVAQSDTVGGDGIILGNGSNREWMTRFGTNTDLTYNLDFYDGSSWTNKIKLTYTGQLTVGGNHVQGIDTLRLLAPNTILYLDAATDIVLRTSSTTERMRITSAGAIEIKGSSTTTNAQAYITNSNSILSIGSSTSGSVAKPISFHVGSLQPLTISSGGVATFNTSGNNGVINIGGSTYYSQFETNAVLGGLKIKSVWGGANSGIIQFINGTNNNVRMHIADNGNVLVGLANPATNVGKFEVETASAIAYTPTANITGTNLRLATGGTAATNVTTGVSMAIGGNAEAYIGAVQNSSGYADIVFQSYNGSYSEKMRITSAGNATLAGYLQLGTSTSQTILGDFGETNTYLINYNSGGTIKFLIGGGASSNEKLTIGSTGYLIQNSSQNGSAYIQLQNQGTTLGYLGNGTSLTSDGTTIANELVLRTDSSLSLNTSGTTRVRISSAGEVTIPYYAASSITSLNVTTGGLLTTASSDISLKKDINNLNYGINEVLKLNPVSFYWIDNDYGTTREIGFVAQEIEKVVPEVVTENNLTKLKAVNYDKITSLLTKAIQEQQTIIEDLKARIQTLEG